MGTNTIKSNGERSARGYAAMQVGPAAPEPSGPEQRVVVLAPSQTPTRTGPRAGSGPRNPQQTAWPPPKGPAIVLPDGRPLTKAQRFWIDPELFVQWDAEARARSST
jgi:hypothetical protein